MEWGDREKRVWGALEGAGLVQGTARHFTRLECECGRERDSRQSLGQACRQVQNLPPPPEGNEKTCQILEVGYEYGEGIREDRDGRERQAGLLQLKRKRWDELETQFA